MPTFDMEKSDKLTQAKDNLERYKSRLQQIQSGVNSFQLTRDSAAQTIDNQQLNQESYVGDFDTCFDLIREPKKQGYIPGNNSDLMSQKLLNLGIEVCDYEINVNEYRRYFQNARYLEDFADYYSFNRVEKSLEHYLATKLLKLDSEDIYIDVASETGTVPKIYAKMFGSKTYTQDLSHPPGLNGHIIGGNAADMPLPNEFATKMALHCSFEHFEDDSDIGFVKEAARLLKRGGAVCILPLYLFDEYSVQSDPVTAISSGGVDFENDAVIYCAAGFNNRHCRFYDPQHFFDRICRNLNGLKLKIYHIKNAKQVDESCYIQFAAVLEKPLDDNTFNSFQKSSQISYSLLNSSQQKSSLTRANIKATFLEESRADMQIEPSSFSPQPKGSKDKKEDSKRSRKALIFFPHNPYPAKTGAHQRCLEMISALKEIGYQITLFSSTLFTDTPWELSSINELQTQWGVQTKVYQGSAADHQYIQQVCANSVDFSFDQYTPPGLRESFFQTFKSLKPEIVMINYSLWGNLAIGEEFNSTLRLIDTIDLYSLNQKMRQAIDSHLKVYSPSDKDEQLLKEDFYSKLNLEAEREEYAIFDRYDYTLAISPTEAEAIQKHTHRTKVEYVPMTISTELLNNSYTASAILAIGDNPFNVQGYLYFIVKVLPLVREQIAGFNLKVVGNACKHLEPVDGVQLLGFVTDLKPLYAESRFAICPLIGGTGQQVKIVEAMAHGIPVIALRNVAQSSPIKHGINGFIAEDAQDFAHYAIQLYGNPELCCQLGQAAQETIATEYSQENLIEKIKQITAQYYDDFNQVKLFSDKIKEISCRQPTITVDGVFFQLNNTGIARVWKHLLEEWVKDGFAKDILVLDRAGTAPKISGVRYRLIPEYNYGDTDRDRQILQQVCDEEGVDVFISTYNTTPLSTPSVFMGYDMIPELTDHTLDNPMWREKHQGIRHASAYITISENTKCALAGCFPNILVDSITVAHCGIDSNFTPASQEEIIGFKSKYEIRKPYFLVVGERIGWHHYKNTTSFFEAFHNLPNWQDLEIVCVGGHPQLEDEIKVHVKNSRVHLLRLSDVELKIAYSGAVALVYPSLYEGFGMPVAEAMACGCPVITCPFASLPEVGGKAVLYVSGRDVNELVEAMIKVQKHEVRESLIRRGLEQSKLFSWSKMAEIVKFVLIETARVKEYPPIENTVSVRTEKYKVSAIISTYNSEKYIRGCLQNLVDQTLYKQGELEIVIVDSASQQNEQSIVKEFQAQYQNIVYQRTPERETLYAAWNRAIKMSQARYITNANTDDRHRCDALEVMANFLDTHPEVSLAYPDQLITTVPNDTFVTTQSNRHWNWPPYSYEQMKQGCCVGSQPMWRKSLHDKYGYFRSEFHCAGDYEFWLRIGSQGENMALISEILGLYYFNPQGIEHGTPGRSGQETDRICDEYEIKRLYIPQISGSERKFDDLQYQGALVTDEQRANLIRHQQLTVNYQYETQKKVPNPLIGIIPQPIVSVIIPTKDRPEMLAQAIQSVLTQTFTELEIIVVNDGGVDVQSVISGLNTKSNIVYKKHDRPLDRSAARNTGIRAARGKYIAYLDDDDIYYPNHIETIVKFLENSKYKIAYTDAVMAQQEKQNGEYVTVHRSVPYSLDLDNDKILVSNCTPNLCLMHEKSCLDEVGLFDESLSTHEDWDLIIRLSRKFNIAHIKETTCEFTQRNDGTNTSSHNRADFTRTREVIFNQYYQYAEANPAILAAQKDAFIAEAKELAQQVQQIQAQFTQSLDKLQSQLEEKESHLQQTQAEKSQLATQVETWQRSTQEVQAKLEATQSEKEWVKSQLNSWKQTAEEMQIELERSRSKLKQAQSQLERSAFPLGKS